MTDSLHSPREQASTLAPALMSSAGAPGDWANINALLLANGFPTMLLDGPGQSPGLPAMHTAMMEVLSVLVSPCMHVHVHSLYGSVGLNGRPTKVHNCMSVFININFACAFLYHKRKLSYLTHSESQRNIFRS